MKLLIVTGLSGAGKSQALRCLEDIGFFCVDNLPPALIPTFSQLCSQQTGQDAMEKVAIGVDMRGRALFRDLFKGLNQLKDMGFGYEILFLDATDEVLVKRFKETRRRHPLLNDEGRLERSISLERKALNEVKRKSTYVIDTSAILIRQLKEELIQLFVDGKEQEPMVITVLSFGFKYGIPIDIDLVFDVRFIPNPYYIDSMKELTGRDEPVREYVMQWDVTKQFVQKTSELLEFLIPNYIKEGKSHLVIGIGCTGGKHRSVTIANALYESILKNGHRVVIEHRDIDRKN